VLPNTSRGASPERRPFPVSPLANRPTDEAEDGPGGLRACEFFAAQVHESS
jgi:hypothetical protein